MSIRKKFDRAGMHCPKCDAIAHTNDSRGMKKESAVRRRRVCTNPECQYRFTTIEMVTIRGKITVVKRNGLAEPFDREKITRSMRVALAKRHITEDRLRNCVDVIQNLIDTWDINSLKQLPANKARRITSAKIGFLVSESLKELDTIGYIRYMSVWKKFYHVDDFQNLIDSLYEPESSPADTATPRE